VARRMKSRRVMTEMFLSFINFQSSSFSFPSSSSKIPKFDFEDDDEKEEEAVSSLDGEVG